MRSIASIWIASGTSKEPLNDHCRVALMIGPHQAVACDRKEPFPHFLKSVASWLGGQTVVGIVLCGLLDDSSGHFDHFFELAVRCWCRETTQSSIKYINEAS